MRMSAEERRAQLLDATKAVVGEQGFHGVSIDAVASGRGQQTIVYAHFGDLGGLLQAMLERESESALRQLAEVLPTQLEAESSREALLSALRAYLEVVRADPVTWRLVLMPPEGAPQLLRDQITSGRDAVIDVLATAVERGASPGPVSPDPELTAGCSPRSPTSRRGCCSHIRGASRSQAHQPCGLAARSARRLSMNRQGKGPPKRAVSWGGLRMGEKKRYETRRMRRNEALR